MKHQPLPPVLILFNRPNPRAELAESDAGVLEEVSAVAQALRTLRVPHRSAGLDVLTDAPAVLAAADEPVVFNLVEGFHDRPEQANLVPAICQAFGKACTGGTTESLTLSLHKGQAKAVLASAGLPTPLGAVVAPGQSMPAGLPDGPLIVKPACTDASEGIEADSVVSGPGEALAAIVAKIHRQFNQPAVIEQFVGRRELNVSVLQREGRLDVLPLAEIDFSAFDASMPRIVDYSAKWRADSFAFHNTPRLLPAPLPEELADRVRGLARQAFAALGCQDYVRVDFRLDVHDQPVILEINVNPDISPDAGFAAALEAGGISYEQFVATVVGNAADRLAGQAARRP